MCVIGVTTGIVFFINHTHLVSLLLSFAQITITLSDIFIKIITQTLISASILLYYQPDKC